MMFFLLFLRTYVYIFEIGAAGSLPVVLVFGKEQWWYAITVVIVLRRYRDCLHYLGECT